MKTEAFPGYILINISSRRYLVEVGDTGFKTTMDRNKATRFADVETVGRFKLAAGITWPVATLLGTSSQS